MRKKLGILFSVTAVMILGIIIAGNYSKSQAIHVETIVLQAVTEENTVTCSGKVENSKEKNVYADQDSVTQEVYVEAGQRVEKGDVLMTMKTIEKSEENEKSSSFSEEQVFSQYAGLSSSLNSPQLQQIYDQYLQQAEESEVNSSAGSDLGKEQIDTETSTGQKEEIVQVMAPISGIVSSVNVQQQEEAGFSPVAVILEDEGLRINLSVNESQISGIEVGQKAEITGVGFEGKIYSGTVSRISNIAQQVVSSGGQETVVTVMVEVDKENQEDLSFLKSGFTAKCKIIKSINENCIVVPYEAVLAEDNGQEYVYKVIDNRAVKTYITTGKEFENGFEVTDGLESGDEIIGVPDQVSDFQRVIRVDQSVVSSYGG